MPYGEGELLPLSGLQHLVYCERQAALIHIEQAWMENAWTAEGTQLHDQVATGKSEMRGEVRVARDLALRSLRLGLTGRADVVEFRRASTTSSTGARVLHWPGTWVPYPIEYKRGRPKHHRADEVQLCAQAICIEEMLGVPIEAGALFYGQTRHRREVHFDAELRAITEDAAVRFRVLVDTQATPKATYDPARCDECSLLAICRPRAGEHSVRRYLDSALHDIPSSEGQ